jgi:hypothetical protein
MNARRLVIAVAVLTSHVALGQPAKATGPNPHLFPQDQTWPKTGTPFTLSAAKIDGRLPASSPNTYTFGTTKHYGLAIDTMVRTSPGPGFAMIIEPTYIRLSSTILSTLGVDNQCRSYVAAFIGQTAERDRPASFPLRFNEHVRTKDGFVIACVHVESRHKRPVVDVTTDVSSTDTLTTTPTTITVTTTTTTTTTTGPVDEKIAAFVFLIKYDGDLDSADFATIAPDLEAVIGAIHEKESFHSHVIEWNLSFAHLGVGGGNASMNGARTRFDMTAFQGFPWAMAFDLDYLRGGGAQYLDMEYSVGLGRYVGPVGFGVLAGAGLESLVLSSAMMGAPKNPWLVNLHPELTVAVNAGPNVRVRGYVRPEWFVTDFGGDAGRVDMFKHSASVGDQLEVGATVAVTIGDRGAANSGKGSWSIFVGGEYRKQWQTSATMFTLGFGQSTGSYAAPPIDPSANPIP